MGSLVAECKRPDAKRRPPSRIDDTDRPPGPSADALTSYYLQMRQDDPGQSFGTHLARLIDNAGFTSPSAFARAVPTASGKGKLDPSTVLRWISGDTLPTLKSLHQIAPVLKVDANDLVARAYGKTAPGVPADPPAPQRHPLVRDLDRLLDPASRMTPAERKALEAVINGAVEPYRRHLRGRRPA